MVLRLAALTVGLLLAAAASALCADAPMAKYDPQQTGYTSERLAPPLSLLWDFTANRYDNNPTAPAVVEGVGYFACGDRVYAVEVETGTLKWKYPSDQGLGGTVKGTPAVYGDNVYFGAGDGNLYCVSAETGTFQWAYQTRGPIRCPPVIVDGTIYFGSDDNSLYAVKEGGDAAWPRFTARDDIAVGVAVGMGMAVVSCMDGNMYGVNANSGRLRWVRRLPVAPTNSSPVISENIVVMAVGSQMFGLSLRSGQPRWSVVLPSDAAASPAVDGSDIYVPCRDKSIYAYTATGRRITLKWSAPAELGAIPMSSPVIAEDVVYATGSRGVVAAFSTQDGSPKWRYIITPSAVTTPSSYFTDAASSPVVADKSLFVLTDDGVLHRFTTTAPDNAPPEVFSKAPTSGKVMSGAPPIKMSAVLYDIGSGVDFSTVSLYLDAQPIPDAKIDIPMSSVSYETEVGEPGKAVKTALADGPHIITLTAKDFKGNQIRDEWYFIADASMPPPKRVTPTEEPGKKIKEPPRRERPTPPPTPPAPPGMPGGGEQPSPYPQPPPPPPMPGPGQPVPVPVPVPGPGGPVYPGGAPVYRGADMPPPEVYGPQ